MGSDEALSTLPGTEQGLVTGGVGGSSASEVAQSCLTLCDPIDCSLPDSSIHGISRQQYWSGLPFPSPGDHPDPGIEPGFPTL